MPLAVWATGLTALTTQRRYEAGEFCTRVQLAGLPLASGAVAVGDENGIVFMERSLCMDTFARVRTVQERQGERHALIARGEPFDVLNGTREAFARIRAAKGTEGGSA